MIASARASHADIGPHQKSSGSARSGPSSRKQRTSPKFDGLKMCEPRKLDHVLREQRDGGRAGEDPPAVQAPPVAVLGPGHAQDEGDAVPGQHRARRPHQHVLARRTRSRPRARAQVPIAIRIWAIESRKSNATWPSDLQRDDHRGEVQPRVAQRRQQDRVRPCRGSSEPARRGQLARGRSWAAHGTPLADRQNRPVKLDQRSRSSSSWSTRRPGPCPCSSPTRTARWSPPRRWTAPRRTRA